MCSVYKVTQIHEKEGIFHLSGILVLNDFLSKNMHQFWLLLVKIGQNRSKSVHFCPFVNLVQIRWFWSKLVHFCLDWYRLVQIGPDWSILVQFGPISSILVRCLWNKNKLPLPIGRHFLASPCSLDHFAMILLFSEATMQHLRKFKSQTLTQKLWEEAIAMTLKKSLSL